ncbi:hypothetical protein V22_03070 [Calycomorphotria hydatis]|uniref:SLA1 homology domain-containing protein n=2 Tax=Calycomorphotria hydatis TaxID=2528027 RepID=A0A517T405_9PLAN|nr:hypothetical protein V22_03070 [Calycomorphotria hydatis]
MRTWKDASGNFELPAKFVKKDGDTVFLKGESGQEFEIGIDKLSDRDQKFIADGMAAENPFKASSPRSDSKSSSSGSSKLKPVKSEELKFIDFNFDDVPKLSPEPVNAVWSLTPDPEQGTAIERMRPFKTPPTREFSESFETVCKSPESGRILIGYSKKGHGSVPAYTRLVLCDLVNSRVIQEFGNDEQYVPLALDETGTKCLVRSEAFGFGNNNRLEQWDISSDSITKNFISNPYPKDGIGTSQDIEWAAYGAGETFITASKKKKLLIWDRNTYRPLAQMELDSNQGYALSPGRRYLTVVGRTGIWVVDLVEKTTVAQLDLPNGSRSSVAFTPSGNQIVSSNSSSGVEAWDFMTGDSLTSFVPNQVSNQFICLDDQYLLMREEILLDTNSRISLWEYRGSKQAVFTMSGMTWMCISDGIRPKYSVIYGGVLPHPEALQTLEDALKNDDVFAVKPGVPVSIDVSQVSVPEIREELSKELENKLLERQFRIDPSADVSLVASIFPPRNVSVTYYKTNSRFPISPFSRPSGKGETVQMPVYDYELKLVFEGRVLWIKKGAYNTAPSSTSVGDKSIAEALRPYREKKPSADLFKRIVIPEYLQSNADTARSLGQSEVKANGIH